ncbi:MAG: DUF2911 domain-containing protein [Acidobacteriota bacterium]|nr:DUF2911 domain-containing protein [Acidobacteriota bacterium]
MKIQNKLFLSALFVLTLAVTSFAQQAAVQIPRESPRAELTQIVGDTRMTIVYHRPSTKGREVWGKLVPYGQVWRTGANENTTFEVSENVRVNGQDLPAGKYGLHTIPNKDEWTIIFSKKNDEWGSFTYKPENDALRVKTKPETRPNSLETMMFEFEEIKPNSTTVVIRWEKLKVPFTVEVVGVQERVLGKLRQQIAGLTDATKAQNYIGARMTAANFVVDNKIKSAYADAATWVDEALKVRETFNTLRGKARISAEMGNYKDAVMYGEKAITVGKAAQPAVNADLMANFEKDVAGWKTRQ